MQLGRIWQEVELPFWWDWKKSVTICYFNVVKYSTWTSLISRWIFHSNLYKLDDFPSKLVGITSDLVMHPFIKDCPATFTGGYMFYFRDVRWSGAGDRKGMLWMVAKSCIILDGWNPINNGIYKPPFSTGAGFLASTADRQVGHLEMWGKYHRTTILVAHWNRHLFFGMTIGFSWTQPRDLKGHYSWGCDNRQIEQMTLESYQISRVMLCGGVRSSKMMVRWRVRYVGYGGTVRWVQWVRYGGYGGYGTVGTVGTVQWVRWVRYSGYSGYGTVGTVRWVRYGGYGTVRT